MPVYVDDFRIPATVPNGNRTVKGVWCHMTADTTEELLEMAEKIGLKPQWIQHPGTWKEHFDVTEPRRRAAVANGAIEVAVRESVLAMQERWAAKQDTAAPHTSQL